MRLFLCFIALADLAACRTSTAPQVAPPRPVKVTVAADASTLDRDFAGMATPDDAVNLSFRLAGQVAAIPVSRGESVRTGALLAELDAREIRSQVQADRAAYDQAASQFDRMKRLLDHQAISVQEYEAARTAYARARSTWENSRTLLDETKIRAPFAGVIEATYVDTWQQVAAGQTILRIVNPLTTTVQFTLPESALRLLELPSTRFEVRFDAWPAERFAARLKDYAPTSSDASGFPVSLTVENPDPKRFALTPGMACTITMIAADPVAGAVTLPLTALYAPIAGDTSVWVVRGGRVELRGVRLGVLVGRDRVVVVEGVRAGDTVVTAGVYKLEAGERVQTLENERL